MSRHEELAALWFAQRDREDALLAACDAVVGSLARAVAEVLGSPPDGVRHCRIVPGSPPRLGEPLGDVREFGPPQPVLNPLDDFFCFALEWVFRAPADPRREAHYAVRFGIDGRDGAFVLKHGNGKELQFAATPDGVRGAAEFVCDELRAEFSRPVTAPATRIGFVTS